ncbi:MAG: hypothetical protein SEPTF4163_000357 [Sporothrix epigloea]
MFTAQPSARGARALRAAAGTLPSSAQTLEQPPLHLGLQRLFSSRTAAPHSLVAEQMRPRRPKFSGQSFYCHGCRAKASLQSQKLSGRRHFHLATFANTTVNAAEAAIAQLHAITYTPWYITIPLVALSVNLLVRLPFSIHAQEVAIKRARLRPLLQAWTSIHGQQVIKERKRLQQEQRLPGGGTGYMSMPSIQAEVLKRFKKTSTRIYATFGVQQWKLYGTILALPPWLVVIEAIRRMCGAPTGLLGMILRTSSDGAATGATAEETLDAAITTSASSKAIDAVSFAGVAPPSTVPEGVSALADPSFVTGGCLWFPDLTVADPYQILPFALSAMLVVNVLPSTDLGRRSLFGLSAKSGGAAGAGKNSSNLAEPAAARALQRTLFLMSIFVGPLTLHFPAAIHLYWLSSAAVSYMITRIIRMIRTMPRVLATGDGRRELPWIVPPNPNTQKEAGRKA